MSEGSSAVSSTSLAPRLARPAEHERIGRLTVAAYLATGALTSPADPYASTLADAATRAAKAELYVVTDDHGTVMATMTLAEAGRPFADVAQPGELELRMLAVDPTAQGQGIGSLLVAFAAEQARARGLRALAISVIERNLSALRLYDRLGFVRRPDRDIVPRPGVHLLALTLDLAAGDSGTPTTVRAPG